MKNIPSPFPRLHRRLLLSVSVGCALALSPAALVHAQSSSPSKEEASKPQPGDPTESKKGELNQANPGGTVKLSDDEVAFIKAAGAGNAAEIKMAELALKNAESQEVKDFAQMMIKDHTQANDDLAVIAKNHNITFPPDAPKKEKEMGKKMLDLKGAAFDQAYINHMVKGHTDTLAEYKKAGTTAKDPKLVEYIDKTTPVVEGHLKAVEELKAKMKKS